MTVLAQISRWIPDRIIENLVHKHKIQRRSFRTYSNMMAILLKDINSLYSKE